MNILIIKFFKFIVALVILKVILYYINHFFLTNPINGDFLLAATIHITALYLFYIILKGKPIRDFFVLPEKEIIKYSISGIIAICIINTILFLPLQINNFIIYYGNNPYSNEDYFFIFFFPIVEEIFYRKFVIDSFLVEGSQKKALWFSSILFVISHISFGIGESSNLFSILFGGLFLGYVYIKTKSIILTIGLHLLNNLILTIFLPKLAHFLAIYYLKKEFLSYGYVIVLFLSLLTLTLTIRKLKTTALIKD